MRTKEKNFFPLFVDLSEKKAVVLGAGVIASRRAETLLEFVGEITVVAPACTEKIARLAAAKKLVYRRKFYEKEDLREADIVFAATDDQEINEDIFKECRRLGIPVNVASDRLKCDFHFPGILEYEGVVMGFNGSGRDHKKVKEVRQKTKKALEQSRKEEKICGK